MYSYSLKDVNLFFSNIIVDDPAVKGADLAGILVESVVDWCAAVLH